MSRPNILLIHADQHRADCIGANGHPFIQTPNLDRLAAEGANFTRAYTPIPLCTPARTSLLTGQWATQHGVIANPGTEAERRLAEGTPTFSQALRDSGYFLGYVGKWGVDSQHAPTHYGFHAYLSERDYIRQRQGLGLPAKPQTNGWFGEVDPGIRPEQSQLAWGADMTIGLLRHAAAQASPFFLRWDPSEPHLPNVVPAPYAQMYDPAQIQPWPNFADPLVGKPFIQRQQRRTWGLEGWSWEQWAPIVSRYLGEITLLDHQLGRVLATLAELGLADNTVVIYSADHGDLCGGHGMIDKHYVMYEELVRVPLLLRWPAMVQAGQQINAFVSHALDLAATFCAVAGVEPPKSFAGRSLLPYLTSTDPAATPAEPEARKSIFATYHGNQFGLYTQRMVRTPTWKYIWNATAEDELYDLVHDPNELTNLAANHDYTNQLSELRLELLTWMEQSNDRALNPWLRRQLQAR